MDASKLIVGGLLLYLFVFKGKGGTTPPWSNVPIPAEILEQYQPPIGLGSTLKVVGWGTWHDGWKYWDVAVTPTPPEGPIVSRVGRVSKKG